MSKPQLFCYTYAGGNASFFTDIENDLKAFDVIKFEYAGHGTRHKEPFYRDFAELAEDAYQAFQIAYNGGCYALFGYSMGCISLVTVIQVFNDMNTIKPEIVLAA